MSDPYSNELPPSPCPSNTGICLFIVYYSIGWEANQINFVNKGESVQKRKAIPVCNDLSPHSNVSFVVQKLGLRPFNTRHTRKNLTRMF